MTKKEAMIHILVKENDELKTEIGRLRQALEQVPARKKGKWVYTPQKRLVDETDEGPVYEVQEKCNCSVCGADFGYCKVEDSFCKYCGAEMESEDGSN